MGKKPGVQINGLSDAVFGFAVTLLIVSLEVPKTYSDLIETLRGFVAFVPSFALLTLVWYRQQHFFRRYTNNDVTLVTLNSIILFVVLFSVYPVKFLFSSLVDRYVLRMPEQLTSEEFGTLMVIFGVGYWSISSLFALLYGYALHRYNKFDLDAEAVSDAQQARNGSIVNAVAALVSLLLALFGGQLANSSIVAYPVVILPWMIYIWRR